LRSAKGRATCQSTPPSVSSSLADISLSRHGITVSEKQGRSCRGGGVACPHLARRVPAVVCVAENPSLPSPHISGEKGSGQPKIMSTSSKTERTCSPQTLNTQSLHQESTFRLP
jgi:hypothetical protein